MFDDYTRLTEGQKCPVTSIKTISGEEIRLVDAEDTLPFLINFFIAQCQHCSKAMQFIENNICKAVENRMKIISIGRNHTVDEVTELKKEKGWSCQLAADPDRAIYDFFAEKKIPRTYLFSTGGELIHQVRGYNEEEYMVLKEHIGELLADSDPPGRARPTGGDGMTS